MSKIVSKMTVLWKILKISELIRMIIDDSRELQEDVLRDRGFQKTHQLEKFETFQKHPKPTTSDLENGSKSQISLCAPSGLYEHCAFYFLKGYPER